MPFPARPSIIIAAIVLAMASSTCILAAPDLKAECVNALKQKYGDGAQVLQVAPVISATTGFAVDGSAEIAGQGKRRFACSFEQNRKLQGLVIGPPD